MTSLPPVPGVASPASCQAASRATVRQLLREIRELGYQGSPSLLVRYINQGRAEGGRPHLSPRRAARILLTRPDRLTAGQHETLAGLTAACPR